jgi:hypothetical protein
MATEKWGHRRSEIFNLNAVFILQNLQKLERRAFWKRPGFAL